MKYLIIILVFWAYVGVYLYSQFPALIDLVFAINSLLVAFVTLANKSTYKLGVFALIAIMPDFFYQIMPYFGVNENILFAAILTLSVFVIAYFPKITHGRIS